MSNVSPSIPRPFLKWAGGKTQLVEELLASKPDQFNTYYEPFVGSGALFFCLYRKKLIKKAILSDINAELIDTYIAIRDYVLEVINLLSEFPYDKRFYYDIRGKNPWQLNLTERAARMIYLNKTGYNGLYRVNRKGLFNVPFGKYKFPKYLDRENLLAVSHSLQNVEIKCIPFDGVVRNVHCYDWIYFDPPYVPLSRTSNFTSYYPDGFGFEDHKKLRDICKELGEKGVYVMVSNSDIPFVRELYSTFYIKEVLANRAINCKGTKRGKIKELVITNYSVSIRS